MNSTERVRRVITGQSADRTPIYGWCSGNFPEKVTEYFGSPAALEDRYEFDAAHIFGGPATYNEDSLNEIRASGVEFTPDLLLDLPLMVGVMALMILPALLCKKLGRWQGITLLLIYAAFCVAQFML